MRLILAVVETRESSYRFFLLILRSIAAVRVRVCRFVYCIRCLIIMLLPILKGTYARRKRTKTVGALARKLGDSDLIAQGRLISLSEALELRVETCQKIYAL